MMRAGKDYGVRVISAYENKRVGQVIYPSALERDALVRGGLVERVKESVAPAADDAESDDGLFTRGRRKMGRK